MDRSDFQGAEWGVEELVALCEAVKTPLYQIRSAVPVENDMHKILHTTITHSLQDIDSFVESVIHRDSSQLSMHTLSIGSILEDVAQKSAHYARMRNVTLRVVDKAKHQPIIGDFKTMEKSVLLMLRAVLDMPTIAPSSEIILRADTRHGYPRLGVFRNGLECTSADIKRAVELFSSVRGPIGSLSQLGSLRLAVAARLLSLLGAPLRSGISNGNRGVVCICSPSSQLGLFLA